MMNRYVNLTAVAIALLCFLDTARAQPLVTGNLTLYYDFDEIVTNADGEKQFLDESGNNFPGTIFEGDPDIDTEPGTLTVNTENPLRGAGAASFNQSVEPLDGPVYVDVNGQYITENFPELLPTGGLNDLYGLTVAAWLNVTANDVGDQSVFQGRTSSGGHGAPHFQLQGSGKLRMTFRDQNGSTIVDAPQVFIDGALDAGEPYPVDEWFHYAGTYDADEGLWAQYYNGELLQEGEANGDLGDWGGQEGELFGAGFGAVYDSGGRRFDGLMDELYVFNRALTAAEIKTLATRPAMVLVGDCNGDGVLDKADLECVADIAERDAVLGAIGTLPGDLDGNGAVEFSDFLVLAENFDKEGGYTSGNIDLLANVAFADFLILAENFGKTPAAAAASVPEPSTWLLATLAVAAIGLRRRRER